MVLGQEGVKNYIMIGHVCYIHPFSLLVAWMAFAIGPSRTRSNSVTKLQMWKVVNGEVDVRNEISVSNIDIDIYEDIKQM